MKTQKLPVVKIVTAFFLIWIAILIYIDRNILADFANKSMSKVLGISTEKQTPTPIHSIRAPFSNKDDVTADNIINFINSEREKAGLSNVTENNQLDTAALNKIADMLVNNYWSMTSPTGETLWTFIQNSGYQYEYAGMDLAKGYKSASDVVNSWMNNLSDKSNILNPKYTDIGLSIEQGTFAGEKNTIVVVQALASRKQSVSNNNNQLQTNQIQQQTQQPENSKGNSNEPFYQNYGWYMRNGVSMQYVNGQWYSTPQQGLPTFSPQQVDLKSNGDTTTAQDYINAANQINAYNACAQQVENTLGQCESACNNQNQYGHDACAASYTGQNPLISNDTSLYSQCVSEGSSAYNSCLTNCTDNQNSG